MKKYALTVAETIPVPVDPVDTAAPDIKIIRRDIETSGDVTTVKTTYGKFDAAGNQIQVIGPFKLTLPPAWESKLDLIDDALLNWGANNDKYSEGVVEDE